MRRLAVVSIVLLAAACSLPDVEPVVGETPPSTSTTPLVTPWRATSRRIEIFSSQQSISHASYDKERGDLSAEQLRALGQMRVFTPARSQAVDSEFHIVRVTDEDGTVVSYSSDHNKGLVTALGKNARFDGSIDYDTLEPFLASIEHCVRATEAWQRRLSPVPIAPTEAAISIAPSLSLDAGCRNLVYLRQECGDALLTLHVPTRATYELTLERCVAGIVVRVYESDRTSVSDSATLVAESATAPSGACGVVRHTFDSGNYVIAVSKTNPSNFCPVSVGHGDDGSELIGGRTWLRVRAVP